MANWKAGKNQKPIQNGNYHGGLAKEALHEGRIYGVGQYTRNAARLPIEHLLDYVSSLEEAEATEPYTAEEIRRALKRRA